MNPTDLARRWKPFRNAVERADKAATALQEARVRREQLRSELVPAERQGPPHRAQGGELTVVLVRLCPACGCHLPYPGRGKCQDCQREYERKRGTRRQRGYTDAWLRLVKLAIREQPYCSVPGCTDTDLTGDHRVPLSRGGTSTLENVQVLCRRHNSAKRDRNRVTSVF